VWDPPVKVVMNMDPQVEMLKVEIWNDGGSFAQDKLIGTSKISVMDCRTMHQHAKPKWFGVDTGGRVQLQFSCEAIAPPNDSVENEKNICLTSGNEDNTTCLELAEWVESSAAISIEVLQGRGLESAGWSLMNSVLQPFVKAYLIPSFKDAECRTLEVVDGGTNPVWQSKHQRLFALPVGSNTDSLCLEVWDTGMVGESIVGSINIKIVDIFDTGRREGKHWYSVHHEGKDVGALQVVLQAINPQVRGRPTSVTTNGVPNGIDSRVSAQGTDDNQPGVLFLRIKVIQGKNLKNTAMFMEQSPYVKCFLLKDKTNVARTKCVIQGGTNPKFGSEHENTMELEVGEQHSNRLMVEIWSQETVIDTLIGKLDVAIPSLDLVNQPGVTKMYSVNTGGRLALCLELFQ